MTVDVVNYELTTQKVRLCQFLKSIKRRESLLELEVYHFGFSQQNKYTLQLLATQFIWSLILSSSAAPNLYVSSTKITAMAATSKNSPEVSFSTHYKRIQARMSYGTCITCAYRKFARPYLHWIALLSSFIYANINLEPKPS